ncbi:13960_t:CDS:2 [Funneliformis geosporum]|nr:13960_t:CDS:2 [Funneliformis geosporum]
MVKKFGLFNKEEDKVYTIIDNLANQILVRCIIVANRLTHGVDKESEENIMSLAFMYQRCHAIPEPKIFSELPRKEAENKLQELVNQALSGDQSLLQKLTDLPYLSQSYRRELRRSLRDLDAATSLKDLSALPGNRLRKMEGQDNHAYEVEIKMLREEFLVPAKLTPKKLAQGVNIPVEEIEDILEEKKDLSTDMACRLALFFAKVAFPKVQLSLGLTFKMAQVSNKPPRQPIRVDIIEI